MKRLTLFAAILAAAAIVPTFAQAKPPAVVLNDEAHYGNVDYRLGPGEIPYITEEGGSAATAQSRVEIPYLSHGVGVSSAELFGVSADDRSFTREAPAQATPPVVRADDGWSIDGNPTIAAFALMLGLLAGGAGVAIWYSRKTRLTPA